MCNQGTVFTVMTDSEAPHYRVLNIDINKPDKVSRNASHKQEKNIRGVVYVGVWSLSIIHSSLLMIYHISLESTAKRSAAITMDTSLTVLGAPERAVRG